MTGSKTNTSGKPFTEDAKQEAEEKKQTGTVDTAEKPAEVHHPDRTRFGDWEKDGRCIDF